MREIERNGTPNIPGGYQSRNDGQVSARVYPANLVEALAFPGTTVDVWFEPDVALEEAENKQALKYREIQQEGKIALVLGAGNASSLPPSDTFHKLFHDLCVVILKMNPVNAYLGPLLEEVYEPLIERGFLRIVYGGVEQGSYLVHDELVDEVHMTGSDRTFDAIVFGSGKEGDRRKETNKPLVHKPVDGELGCITPWIIVPGKWRSQDVEEQAAKMAYWMMRHEGYLCFAPRLLIMQKGWHFRQAFFDALVDSLSQVPPIKAYYPGSAQTQEEFLKAHPEAVQIGGDSEEQIPWTVIPGLATSMTDDICFRRESFSGLCAEVLIESSSTPDFLEQAVEFLNQSVWGTLSVTIVVNEALFRDDESGEAVNRAISSLRYGTVALNAPGVWGFTTMVGPWGGFPGSAITDIQSGNARVGNYLMLYRPQKTVVKVPFRMKPYPFLGTSITLHKFSQKLAQFQQNPGLSKLPGLFLNAAASGW